MDVDKLKVAELRAELVKRGLSQSGTKPVLATRLKEFLAAEAGGTDVTEVVDAAAESAETAVLEAVAATGSEEVEKEASPEPEVVDASQLEPVDESGAQENEEEYLGEEEEDDDDPPLSLSLGAGEADELAMEMEEHRGETPVDAAMGTPLNKTTTSESEEKEDSGSADDATRRGVKRKIQVAEEPFVVVEDEPFIKQEVVCLDWFNSDLFLRISKENFMVAEPFYKDGWGYVWAGTRATYGFSRGKVGFEVKLLENLTAKVENDKIVHELRLGWSTDDSSFQLGESEFSYCYGSSGKKGGNSKFEDFGATFAKDDVVGAFIDLESDPVTLTFTKNGESQGIAFSIPKSELEGKALFPHVSTRNIKFEVNFGKSCDGADREAWKDTPEGFTMVGRVDLEDRVGGADRIARREDCELIFLVGLPGSGKTTWANNYAQEHPEKRFNIIGTAALLDHMRVNGQPFKQHFTGKWEGLIQKCTKCLLDWLRVASQRRRNFIIDQTNVFANAQKRKLRPFEGMTRKAVVLVPSEEDYKQRVEAQEKAQCKDVPDHAVMEMKANFSLPLEGEDSPFKEITFNDLQREEATALVEKYNKDAKEKGFGKKHELHMQRKRMRGGAFGRMGMRGMPNPRMRGMRGRFMPFRGGMFRGGPPPGMFPPRGMPMRGGMGPMRGGPPGPMPGRGSIFSRIGGPVFNRGARGGPAGPGPRGGPGGPRGGPGGPRGGGMAPPMRGVAPKTGLPPRGGGPGGPLARGSPAPFDGPRGRGAPRGNRGMPGARSNFADFGADCGGDLELATDKFAGAVPWGQSQSPWGSWQGGQQQQQSRNAPPAQSPQRSSAWGPWNGKQDFGGEAGVGGGGHAGRGAHAGARNPWSRNSDLGGGMGPARQAGPPQHQGGYQNSNSAWGSHGQYPSGGGANSGYGSSGAGYGGYGGASSQPSSGYSSGGGASSYGSSPASGGYGSAGASFAGGYGSGNEGYRSGGGGGGYSAGGQVGGAYGGSGSGYANDGYRGGNDGYRGTGGADGYRGGNDGYRGGGAGGNMGGGGGYGSGYGGNMPQHVGGGGAGGQQHWGGGYGGR